MLTLDRAARRVGFGSFRGTVLRSTHAGSTKAHGPYGPCGFGKFNGAFSSFMQSSDG